MTDHNLVVLSLSKDDLRGSASTNQTVTMALAHLAGLLAILLTLALPARADERILAFASEMDVHADGTMEVSETIRVRSEGDQIRHGIYRDLPTIYRTPTGEVTRVRLTVGRVERDGESEPYVLEGLSNGQRVKIGTAESLVAPGEHSYRILYTISDEIGFFATHDELYWNVTGTGWPFAIDAVEANVRLPGAARILDYTGYTGGEGETGKDFIADRRSDSEIHFATSRGLGPHENLTIVVTWPKGIVAEPTQAQRTQRFLIQNLPIFVSGAGLILLFSYYMWAWLAVGRDPPAGTIVPLFHPPRNLGPADLRYIRRMGYDRKAFAAALIDLGVKGAVKIEDDGHLFTIKRAGKAEDLSPGEAKVAEALLGGRAQITTKNTNHSAWSAAQSALRNALSSAHGAKIFVGNRGYFYAGLALTIAIAIVTALVSASPAQAASLSVFIAVWVAVPGLVLTRAFLRATGGSSLGARIGGLIGGVTLFVFFIPFAGGALVVARELSEIMSFWAPAAIAAAASLNIIFLELLKAPTKDGRKLMDEIEGFRMYLSVAEVHRLNLLNPPQETPKLFEAYLPYALALDVENEWNHRFAGVLAQAAEAPGGYSPAWYSGPRASRIATGGFAGALGSALATAAASASTAPGSRSGMSGGSSGGGGGGGGGGGW
jgi:hypothetical protein